MKTTTWWRSRNELDPDQQRFMELSAEGRYLLTGPPGSGKTNLLLLRMQFFAALGLKNVLFVTFTRELAEFIRTGVEQRGYVDSEQIQTYHSWARGYVREFGTSDALPKAEDFDGARAELLQSITKLRAKKQTKIFDGIFVDEAQDFSSEELKVLLSLSERICISGDDNQGIHQKDGLAAADSLGLETHALKQQFRIGPEIARVADRLIGPAPGGVSLADSSNYDGKALGKSIAEMHECLDRDDQFKTMLELIKVQLDAFRGDYIGVICATKESLAELHARFAATDISDSVALHGLGSDAHFGGGAQVHVITIHSAKGTEFRAVHLYGVEDLKKFPLNKRRVSYTAVTRAKTALHAYRTGKTNRPLEAAFTRPASVEWSSIFERNGDD